MMSVLHISSWVYQWKNFENRSLFGEVMDKSLVSCFLLDHGTYAGTSALRTDDLRYDSNTALALRASRG